MTLMENFNNEKIKHCIEIHKVLSEYLDEYFNDII